VWEHWAAVSSLSAKTECPFWFNLFCAFTNNRFNRRKQGEPIVKYLGVIKSNVLNRVHTVHPSNVECYYLRMILYHVRRPTSFLDFKTIDDVIHLTFQTACQALWSVTRWKSLEFYSRRSCFISIRVESRRTFCYYDCILPHYFFHITVRKSQR